MFSQGLAATVTMRHPLIFPKHPCVKKGVHETGRMRRSRDAAPDAFASARISRQVRLPGKCRIDGVQYRVVVCHSSYMAEKLLHIAHATAPLQKFRDINDVHKREHSKGMRASISWATVDCSR